MNKLLSLILPIYNVEKYLARCFESIYSQGVDENIFEVIAVIDGSPDNSIAVAEEYAMTHKNLIVLEQANGGVSTARNKGIEIAIGESIMFVDPDDSLLPDSLPMIIECIRGTHNDLTIMRSFYDNSNDEIFAWNNRIKCNTIYTGIEAYNNGYTRGSIWGVVYSKEFLLTNNLRFPLHIKNSEDAIFFMLCQIKAKGVQFADIKTYSVLTRDGSASQDMREERISLWFNALEYIKELKEKVLKDSNEVSMADGLTYAIISDITKNSIKAMGAPAKSFLYSHNIKQYLPICKESIRHSKSIHKIMKMIINTSFHLFYCILYIRYKK